MAKSDAVPFQRTTLVGGLLLMVAGLIGLLGSVYFTVQFSASQFQFSGIVASTVADVILLVAFVVLALGVRGDGGIAGRSLTGRAALIVFGGGYLVFSLYALLPAQSENGAAIAVGAILDILIMVAGVVAGVSVKRSGLLQEAASWMLLGLGIWNAVWSIPAFIPNTDLTLGLVIWKVNVLMPAALIVLGVTYALHGRRDAIRRRFRVINENW